MTSTLGSRRTTASSILTRQLVLESSPRPSLSPAAPQALHSPYSPCTSATPSPRKVASSSRSRSRSLRRWPSETSGRRKILKSLAPPVVPRAISSPARHRIFKLSAPLDRLPTLVISPLLRQTSSPSRSASQRFMALWSLRRYSAMRSSTSLSRRRKAHRLGSKVRPYLLRTLGLP